MCKKEKKKKRKEMRRKVDKVASVGRIVTEKVTEAEALTIIDDCPDW